ncbi:hypothetical protein CDD81_7925 [Ophiocordyceps australis]|uniref:F-box domain-containing protein n=1 Tax=Ophiocordyceps australis TaxID=1399860 RepID=A0A2C5Y3M4_9HYPO|nr:hypothetical protein CDD81_7925 [Ophiocordyceps australis]
MALGSDDGLPAPGAPSSTSFGLQGHHPSAPELPNKAKGRHRLLRGLQRISSSPSLNGLRRSKSVGSPYSTRSTLSCVSLAAPGPSQTPPAPRCSSPLVSQTSSHSISTAPMSLRTPTATSDSPLYSDPTQDYLAVRKIENTISPTSPAISTLPTELRCSRLEGQQSRNRSNCHALQRPLFSFWDNMPYEISIQIFSHLKPKELARASRVGKLFHQFCFDGQLWTSLDASSFYREIPAESLTRIILAAGPFVKNLNLRGCVQIEHYKRTEAIISACNNLVNATLEGCHNFPKGAVHSLLKSNENLVHLNLTGLSAVTNSSCRLIAQSCPRLESLNVSWCEKVRARGIKAVIESCSRLKDLRAGEVRGFDDLAVARSIFESNNLEKLVLCGCLELSDDALRIMMHGDDPEIDILTYKPLVPPRKLRHLDLSRCHRLSSEGVKAIAHVTPYLQGLQLSGCKTLTDGAIEPILASTPSLTLLELEEMAQLTNSLLADHLARSPCVSRLEHLSLSYCENIGDIGMLPVMQNCVGLRSADLDNTRISDLVLAEAAALVLKRSSRSRNANTKPKFTLQLAVYDCQNVTWTGIREILFRNTQVRPVPGIPGHITYPTEAIGLKCFYGFQMTVDEHQKRVLQGDLDSANRLERKWSEYMQASEDAEADVTAYGRRRRRAREAQAAHLEEEDGGVGGRRRARTLGACLVM